MLIVLGSLACPMWAEEGDVGTEVNCDETFLADASSFVGEDIYSC